MSLTKSYLRKAKGFTLIELLVVICIIAILAAMLFPVIANARHSAYKATCQSNLRQIASAFSMYAADYDECYPNINDPYLWMGRHWRWPVSDYVWFTANYDPNNPDGLSQITGLEKTILGCPSDPSPVSRYDKTSYGLSACFYHTPEQIDSMVTTQLYSAAAPSPVCVTMRESDVTYPARKAMLADWLGSHEWDSSGWWSWTGGRVYLFADGHAKYYTAKAILPAVSSRPDVARTPFPDINLTTSGIHGFDVE